MEPDAVEMRVLGCLLEKQRTTPDAYPLTLNALRLACNQSTNRDPVVDYDEREIRGALERLGRRRWTRLASWGNSRVMKYRQLVDETLELSESELALLAVLMLRGAQTVGELNQRTERLHRFEGGELEQTLEHLIERRLALRLPRQPGERGQRHVQLLGGDELGVEAASVAASAGGAATVERPTDARSEAPDVRPTDAPAEATDARPTDAPAEATDARPTDRPADGSTADAGAGQAADATADSSTRDRAAPARPTPGSPSDASIATAELVGRIEHLERELSAVRTELRDLREQLGG